MQAVKLNDIQSNPFRNSESYRYIEPKIDSLMESMLKTSYWENIMARKLADGTIQISYGHHRIEAIRRMVADAMAKNDQSPYYYFARDIMEKGVKLNVRSAKELPDEMMLQILAQENKADWVDSAENTCMTILQVKSHIETILKASKNVDEFLKKIGGKSNIKMNAQSFGRFKNNGIGASTVAQFLGDTWSRQTIQDALSVLDSNPETRKLAEQLPSVTLANRFVKLVDGAGQDAAAQVAGMIDKAGLTRQEVEKALELKEKDNLSAVDAVKAVAKEKKDADKAMAEAAKANRPAPATSVEKCQAALERAYEVITRERAKLGDADQAALVPFIDALTTALFADLPEEEEGDEGDVE
jgi:ParB-like chromosome segregation protein Spo0J